MRTAQTRFIGSLFTSAFLLASCMPAGYDSKNTVDDEIPHGSNLAFGSPSPAPTAQFSVMDGDQWIKNYLQYRKNNGAEARAPAQVGWLVNASEMSAIINAARTGGYVHVSLALRDPGNPRDVTLVISGVDINYQHQYIAGSQILEAVHPCPVCIDAAQPATGYRVRNYFYCTPPGGQPTPCPGPAPANSIDEYGF